MIPENQKLVSAFYNNNERTTVETAWKDEDGTVRIYYVQAENGNPEWAKLLTHISTDQLHENTFRQMKESRRSFEEASINIARELGIIEADSTTSFINIFMAQLEETNSETLFKIKLALFDKEHVKNSTDRKLKTELRKADTLLSVIVTYNKFNV